MNRSNLGPLLLLGLGLAWSSTGCAGPEPMPVPTAAVADRDGPVVHRLSAGTMTRQQIVTEPAQRRALRAYVKAPGHAAFPSEAMAHVGSAVRGRVHEVKARLGAMVHQGDALLVVDSAELGAAQSELLQQHSAVRTTAPLVDLSRRSWHAARALFEESQGIAAGEVLRREQEHRRAEAEHATASAAAAAARGRLQLLGMDTAAITGLLDDGQLAPRHTVRAPRDGLVIAVDVVLGDAVGPDRAPLFTLVDPSVLWVLADVPEARLRGLQVGGDAIVHIAAGEPPRRGRIGWIAPAIAEATRTAEVRVELDATGAGLLAGAFVDIDLFPTTGSTEPVLTVPDAAVQFLERRPVVFVPVAGEPGAFTVRHVQTGPAVDGMVPVLQGLQEGEPVVTAGSFFVKAQVLLGAAAEGN